MYRLITCFLLGMTLASASAATAQEQRKVQEEPYVLKAVAAILVAEAGCDKQPGMLGVAEVIRNRAHEKRKSPIAIIKQPGVFSSLLDTDLDSLILKQKDNPEFPVALKIARTLVQKPASLPNTTHRATHFDNVKNSPYWIHFAKATATIGNHRFYRAAY